MADVAICALQGGQGYGAGDSCGQHYKRYGRSIAGGFQRAGGGFAIGSGGEFEDSDGALEQLFVSRDHVHHQVAVDEAEAGHRSGGDHVQDHLVRRGSFHAGRSSEDLGADLGDDGEVSGALKGRAGIAGEGDSASATAASLREGGDRERSASAGSDAEDDVVFIRFEAGDFFASGAGIVFADFGGRCEGFGPSGDKEVNAVCVEGGEDFDGVEGGDASAGSGAYVDEASTAAERGGNLVDGVANLRQDAGYGEGDGGVFGINESGDFECGFSVEVLGRVVGLLGAEPAESGRKSSQGIIILAVRWGEGKKTITGYGRDLSD